MTKKGVDISSAGLHILAMLFMLSDHLWAAGAVSSTAFTAIGRLAFPIFAFMIAEGYAHTGNVGKYFRRLLICAAVSELPFNLFVAGGLVYPFHQNVLWTFLIGLGCIWLMERLRSRARWWLALLGCAAVALAGWALGYVLFVDYFGAGVLMVLVFHIFRGRKWWCCVAQALCLWYINAEMLGGLVFPIRLFGAEIEIVEQSLAVLALVPIWLYRGRQGCHAAWFKWLCYGFYPVHLLVLYVLGRFW